MKKEEIKEAKKAEEKKRIGVPEDKRNILIAAAVIVIVVIALGIYIQKNRTAEVDNTPDMDFVRDVGVVKIRGDGIPGYDIDRDGQADYLSSGFGYYKGLYESGGFDYGPGGIELEEFEVNITLPVLHLAPLEIVESNIGSVVIFAGENVSSGVSVTVIYKTLGPALTTYNVFISDGDGESYSIFDNLSEEGSGTIEEREVEIAGHVVFRE